MNMLFRRTASPLPMIWAMAIAWSTAVIWGVAELIALQISRSREYFRR